VKQLVAQPNFTLSIQVIGQLQPSPKKRPEGGPMNRQIYTALATITFFAMLTVPVIQAQSDMLVANIPFDFHVGKASLPSGEYTVKPLNPETLLIQSKDGSSSAVSITIGATSSKIQDTGKLVFNRYGDQYFLSKVWRPGVSTGRELPKSRSEVEMARNMPKPETTVVAAKTP
jgi:hypothetical protein